MDKIVKSQIKNVLKNIAITQTINIKELLNSLEKQIARNLFSVIQISYIGPSINVFAWNEETTSIFVNNFHSVKRFLQKKETVDNSIFFVVDVILDAYYFVSSSHAIGMIDRNVVDFTIIDN